MSYWRFAAMITTSSLVMFGLMYVHTYTWDHVFFSETRAWMAILMGAVMAIVMLAFMMHMYQSRAVNALIFAGAALALAFATWMVRGQVTVDGRDYMQAMVPHHSIAILTSERARIEDPRVRKLADEIIESQRKEIAEMKYLIRALDREGVQTVRQPEPPPREVTAADVLQGPGVAKTDLEPITDAELARMLGSGSACRFRYGVGDAPVAAAMAPGRGSSRGVVKLNGGLIAMTARYPSGPAEGFELVSGDITVTASPMESDGTAEPSDGEAKLHIGRWLEVGYAGFYRCGE